jgi:hypothetical protein
MGSTLLHSRGVEVIQSSLREAEPEMGGAVEAEIFGCELV